MHIWGPTAPHQPVGEVSRPGPGTRERRAFPARRTVRRRARGLALLAALCALGPGTAAAHDPSAWGGLFRTRDRGATWAAANGGSFVSGAVALAVSPADPAHLLLATDSGVSRSRNGGRDWRAEAPDVLAGTAFAVVFDADGRRALVSGASTLLRGDGERWRPIPAPAGSMPARALAAGSAPGVVYLAGWRGLHRSDDWGSSWTPLTEGLPDEPVDGLAVARGAPEHLYVVAGGRLWVSGDAGRHFAPRAPAVAGRAEAVALDGHRAHRVWMLAGRRLLQSDDGGERWQALGQPLPEPDARVHAIAVLEPIVLVATDRGLYRSPDGGGRWEPPSESLPGHLEAGPLVVDHANAGTVYAGFALTPYEQMWRRAAEGRSALGRLSAINIAGAAAFLALLAIGAAAALRPLVRAHYRVPPRPAPPRHGAA